MASHSLFDVAVGGVVSICSAVHELRSAHSRSEVVVGAVNWYSDAGQSHTVRLLHCRSDWEVGAVT